MTPLASSHSRMDDPVSRGMFCAQPGDPDRLALQCSFKGFYLADMAAGLTVGDRFIKGIGPFIVRNRLRAGLCPGNRR